MATNRFDIAHQQTDDVIAKIEKRIAKEYKQAHKEVTQKWKDYLKKSEAKDKIWQEWVKEGKKTPAEYAHWRIGQICMGQRWAEMKDTLAEDYANTAEIAQSIAKGYRPEVYALNHNYATFDIEKQSQLDTSYTLYSRESVERMYRDNPKLYHDPGKQTALDIKDGKVKQWNKQRVQSVITQGILQGESIPQLAKRLEKVTQGGYGAAVRNARTMMTGVQNAGRIDAQNRAKKMGIPVKKQWLATLDSRTRDWHVELDGEVVETNESFVNSIGEIEYPGDPSADAANVYNCRCCLLSVIEGFEIDVTNTDLRNTKHMEEETYEQWKNRHKKEETEKKTEKPKPHETTINDVSKSTSKRLQNAYENHRIKGNTNAVPLSELEETGLADNLFTANYGKMSVESAGTFDRTLGKLMDEYDTPLTKVRVMTKDEFMYNSNSFGYVYHDYTSDSATMVINPSKCKDITALSDRIKELAEDGYCAKIQPDRADEYVATHEFAHTILNMREPLKNKTNWVNADYDVIKKARKEIEPIYNEYMNEVGSLTKNAKDLELKAITSTDFGNMEKYGNLASSAYDALDAVKISDYSLSDVDEFVAESFANEKLGEKSNTYASKVVDVIDKYFRR